MGPESFRLQAESWGEAMRPVLLNLGLAGSLLFFFTAIQSVTPAQALQKEAPAWRLVKERCSLCHYLERQETKFAPSLKDLFQRQTLMNGKPVNEQTVSEWIAEGSANMPSFKDTLTPEQIREIVNYLKDHPPLESWR